MAFSFAPIAFAKGQRKAPELYSAYDPAQDPAADQSSTFGEPEYLESLKPIPVPRPSEMAASAKISPAKPKRVTQLPSAVKAPPKVTVRKNLPVSSPMIFPPAGFGRAPTRPAISTAVPSAAKPSLAALGGAVERARFSSPASYRLMPKQEYVAQACEAWRGIKDYLLEGGSRADCVTMQFAAEFTYADEWAEALPRALQHGRLSGLKPSLVVIIEGPEDLRHLGAIQTLRKRESLSLEIKKVMLPEVRSALGN